MTFTGSLTFGCLGRIGLSALKARQYDLSGTKDVDGQLAYSLRFLMRMLSLVPPRVVTVLGAPQPHLVIYSDASYEALPAGQISRLQKPPRIGWLLFDTLDRPPQGAPPLHDPLRAWQPQTFTAELPWGQVDCLCERTQQIYPCETFAVLVALHHHRRELQGRDVVWWCDNAGTVATMIKGSCRPGDVDAMIGAAHLIAAGIGCRIWFEWVDSKSNCSDGLSRAGLDCEFCLENGYRPAVATLPPAVHNRELLNWAERLVGTMR